LLTIDNFGSNLEAMGMKIDLWSIFRRRWAGPWAFPSVWSICRALEAPSN